MSFSLHARKNRLRHLGLLLAPAFIFLASAKLEAVTCASGIPPGNPDDIYIVSAQGTVTDTRTRLMWKRCSEGQDWSGTECLGDSSTMNWQEAMGDAEGSTFAGFHDWRLPDIKELQSLVEQCRQSPSINESIFQWMEDGVEYEYWSSTPVRELEYEAWYVDFEFGASFTQGRANNKYARLVRGGE